MKQYKKSEMTRKVGNMEQIAYARPITYNDGLADGLKAFIASNGVLDFTVMQSKCMDIGRLSYKGINLSFLAKPGITGRQAYDYSDAGLSLRSLMGGMCITCGLDNVGPYHVDEGVQRPFHGSIRSMPAEQVCATAQWEGEEFIIRFKADIRQSGLFQENLVIHRTIETSLYSNELHITDIIENQGFDEEEFQILYHCNAGYPLVQAGSRIIIPSKEATPRDKLTSEAKGDTNWDIMDAPKDNWMEQVYYHNLQTDKEDNTFAAVVNDNLKLGFVLKYNKKDLPYLTQWKSIASSDYVIGLEPGNCSVDGRAAEREKGTIQLLKPQESKKIQLTMQVVEGKKNIDMLKI